MGSVRCVGVMCVEREVEGCKVRVRHMSVWRGGRGDKVCVRCVVCVERR